jgi:hypothetical protein
MVKLNIKPRSLPEMQMILLRLALLVMVLHLGGALYEHLVIDPVWPENFALITPERDGLNRKVFWIPMHVAANITQFAALWAVWRHRSARNALWLAIGAYLIMRAWTFAYFIPAALQFEQADPATAATLSDAAWTWVFWSLWRMPFLLATIAALAVALRRFRSQ